jgi:hypothetical protein
MQPVFPEMILEIIYSYIEMKNVVFWDVTPCGVDLVRTDVSEEHIPSTISGKN